MLLPFRLAMNATPLGPFFAVGAVLVVGSLVLLAWGTRAVIRDTSLTRVSRRLLIVGVLGGVGMSFIPVPIDFEYSATSSVRFQGAPAPMTMVVQYPDRRFFSAAWGPVAIMLNGLFGAGVAQLALIGRKRHGG